jgi:hypothetical protein
MLPLSAELPFAVRYTNVSFAGQSVNSLRLHHGPL